jgi:hypothetical protein
MWDMGPVGFGGRSLVTLGASLRARRRQGPASESPSFRRSPRQGLLGGRAVPARELGAQNIPPTGIRVARPAPRARWADPIQ